jgi:V/A-type H+-transporting ATPase subunit A
VNTPNADGGRTATASEATIRWISGPVLRARTRGPFRVNEAVRVGAQGLLGEVIRLAGEELVAQVYEDTTGLRPGDGVRGTGLPLSVPLGPSLLGHIFDGLLRPLAGETLEHYIRPGLSESAPGRFAFRPTVKPGDDLTPGGVFGAISGAGRDQRCLAPPGRGGRIEAMAPEGEYPDDQPLCTLRGPEGECIELTMTHPWPVRRARPVARRLPPSEPMVTGQRILDTLFPVARGGRAALPGGFGTGKTVLQEALAKWCDADVIVYVGCGERGNEMAEVLHELPTLEDVRAGRPLMERTVIIANTSNMAVAAREASIYTAITVAEYFRDQGLHVALMADSTSRWAEALREFSGRLGELPAEGGYPAYLSSRLAEFYERAGHARTLGGDSGSVTIIGAVSPPAGDFSEPVTGHTKRYVRCFWGLDRERAQARFYPAVHPLHSYSEDVDTLAPWWERQGDAQWPAHRRRLLALLEDQARLERMARIVGKDALPPRQQLTLLCAELVNDGFLRQSAFSPVDRYCSPARQSAMLRLVVRFAELAEQALERGADLERIAALPVLRRLQRMGEEIGEDALERFDLLWSDLDSAYAHLTGEPTGAH